MVKVIADLHIHSRYARACSKQLSIKKLEEFARLKGVSLLGTGDFTHAEWQKELNAELVREENGVYYTKTGFPFVCQTEISLIYSQGGRGRRIHNLVLAPSLEVVEQITDALGKRGRLDYDGRPILNIPCPEFVELLRGVDKRVEVIPAHAWTPWFSLFGSMSGFDNLQDCFQDQSKHIHAIETGLSSDPPMNWRLSQLDKINLISFSDSHSFWPWRMGRESTLLELPKLSYDALLTALRTGDGLTGTIEVKPEEGKYHYDGHRNCKVCMHPKQSREHKKICPKCKRPMTIGVLHRVEELADRPEGFVRKDGKSFWRLIPLAELLSLSIGTAVSSKKVWKQYTDLVRAFGDEMKILLDASQEQLAKAGDEKIADLIIRAREGKIEFKPGFDGEYGVPFLDGNGNGNGTQPQHDQPILEEKPKTSGQLALNQF